MRNTVFGNLDGKENREGQKRNGKQTNLKLKRFLNLVSMTISRIMRSRVVLTITTISTIVSKRRMLDMFILIVNLPDSRRDETKGQKTCILSKKV